MCTEGNRKLQNQKLAQSTLRDALNSAGFQRPQQECCCSGTTKQCCSDNGIFAPLKLQGLEQSQTGPAFFCAWRLFSGQRNTAVLLKHLWSLYTYSLALGCQSSWLPLGFLYNDLFVQGFMQVWYMDTLMLQNLGLQILVLNSN